jgi:hypothetical protein
MSATTTSLIEQMAQALPLADALEEWFPRGRTGEAIHVRTGTRWIRNGIGPRKIRLKSFRLGGAIYVSRDAAEEFLAELNRDEQGSCQP